MAPPKSVRRTVTYSLLNKVALASSRSVARAASVVAGMPAGATSAVLGIGAPGTGAPEAGAVTVGAAAGATGG